MGEWGGYGLPSNGQGDENVNARVINDDQIEDGIFAKMESYLENLEKYKGIKDDHPYGVTYQNEGEDSILFLYIDNEAWGSNAHIHLLTIVKQIVIPDIARRYGQ